MTARTMMIAARQWRTGVWLVALVFAASCVPSELVGAMANEAPVSLRHEPTPRPAASTTRTEACLNSVAVSSRLPSASRGVWPLRGDPAFDPDSLNPSARYWYDRLWDSISGSTQNAETLSRATSDDLYTYGRHLHTHVAALLTAFRATGDLALLDEVDRIAEHMRSRLRDSWRGTEDGSDGMRDGFVNWVYRGNGSRTDTGKDLHVFDEMRTHALIAEIAWALHNNRDLSSPNGVPYGDRADTWSRYLTLHFEAKWRLRNAVPRPEFPFLSHVSMHATISFAKYHWYLGQVLDSKDHLAEAVRLTGIVLDHWVAAKTQTGTVWVWPRTLVQFGGSSDYLQPITYARYVIGDAVDLHLDGAPEWQALELVRELARTVTAFVIEDTPDGPAFARDIGGGVPRGGIPASDAEQWPPMSYHAYAVSPIGLLARWDPTGTIANANCVVDAWAWGELRSVHLPAALLLAFSGAEDLHPRY